MKGVLGINQRNIEMILSLNRRRDFRLVDDKLTTKEICVRDGFPTPPLLAAARSRVELPAFSHRIKRESSFVMKPSRGWGGSGIVIVDENAHGLWHCAGGDVWDSVVQNEYLNDVLYGVYTMDNTVDSILAEQRIMTHPALLDLCETGVPDTRIIIYKGNPVCAMMRIPTRLSRGKSNLHAGGFAVAIQLSDGTTTEGWYQRKRISHHPENGKKLAGTAIPFWREIINMCKGLPGSFPLQYIGVDIAVDESGPMILELNARPGLEIQNVVGEGLLHLCRREDNA